MRLSYAASNQESMQRTSQDAPEEAEPSPRFAVPADGSAQVDQRTSAVDHLLQNNGMINSVWLNIRVGIRPH